MNRTIILFAALAIASTSAYPAAGPGEQAHATNDHRSFIPESFKTLADSIPPDSTGMDTLSSAALATKMVPGWNLGNTLEAMPNETSWGNPLTTQKLIDSVKAAGFRSVRIPVAWSKFIGDTSQHIIDTTWLKRVEQVVNYVLNDSMYALVNEHWDGGWQEPTYADSAYVNHRLSTMWKQIAVHFRDYGDHLLFAGTNEITIINYYGTPSKENFVVQNGFNQAFVNAVRTTGGRNWYRYLAVQGYVTNIDYTVANFVTPVDVTPGRLMVEVHYYDPYDFTLNTNDKITQWGMYATDASKTETWANESYADGEFQKMKANFVDKGFGVLLGEYGATIRTNLGSAALDTSYEKYRRYYTQYVTRSMERHHIVPFYWDIGAYGDHGSGIFDRNTGAHVWPDILDAVVDTNSVSPVLGVREEPSAPAGFYLGQNYPNPFNPATMIRYQLPAAGDVTLRVYDTLGREVRTLVHERQSSGVHEVTFDASGLASGVYYYRLQKGTSTQTRRLLVLK